MRYRCDPHLAVRRHNGFDRIKDASMKGIVFARADHQRPSRHLNAMWVGFIGQHSEELHSLGSRDPADAAGLAESIMRDPRRFLTRRQAELLGLLGSGADRDAIADAMGIDADSVSRATVRLRNRIAELS